MEAPVLVILFGGMIADFMIAGVFFAAIGLLAVAIGLIVVTVVYFKRVGEAIRKGAISWLVNLILSPPLGTLAGILLVRTVVHPVPLELSKTTSHLVLFGVFLVGGIYGFFVAPFITPLLLMARPDTRRARLYWALSYLSFACMTYAWIAMYYADVAHVSTCPQGVICFN